jgi:hypothetical protein
MGLLDEAIREHLELKRRRGADPTEIERLEREALGPARRIQAEPAADDAPELAGEPAEYGLGADLGEDLSDIGHDDEFAEADDLEYATEHEQYAVEESEPADATQVLRPEEAEVHGVVPPPEPHPSDRPVYEDPGVETAEYDVEAEHEAEQAGDEDVLEETPEFLQDAPDHDRLWFEQRPPKDFDFDG